MSYYIYKSNKEGLEIYALFSNRMIRTIEYASRVCYDANEKATNTSWEKYIGARVRSHHESVTEHGMISFILNTDARFDLLAPFTLSNSLIHVVYENGWDPVNPYREQYIFSGNVKMWRDFFKFLIANKHLFTHVFFILFGIFKEFDAGCRGIFTSDFDKYNFKSDAILSGATNFIRGIDVVSGSDSDINFATNIVKDWDSIPLKSFEDYDLIYRMKTPPFDYGSTGSPVVDESFDTGVEQRLINLDNPVTTFFTAFDGKKLVPECMIAFITDHIKDISSITWVVRSPRIITQQEARHRINSISQRSQRYVDEVEKDSKCYTPETVNPNKSYNVALKTGDTITLSYNDMTDIILNFYAALRNDNVPKEDARMILPNAIYSLMVVTKPLYTLDHYFYERCAKTAQREIREPAYATRDYINKAFAKVLNRPLFQEN